MGGFKPKKSVGKEIAGGWVVQDTDLSKINFSKLKTVTKKTPTRTELLTLKLAWKAVKHAKSNAIVVAHNKKIVSISGNLLHNFCVYINRRYKELTIESFKIV